MPGARRSVCGMPCAEKCFVAGGRSRTLWECLPSRFCGEQRVVSRLAASGWADSSERGCARRRRAHLDADDNALRRSAGLDVPELHHSRQNLYGRPHISPFARKPARLLCGQFIDSV